TAGTASLPGAVVLALRAEGWSVFEDTSIAAAEGGPARRIGCVLLHEARGIALVDVVPGGEARIRRADDQTIAGRGGVPV
ncbi:hypothetical protein OFN55_41920, partial [Escherichia coli]|nr:hypothetical protein [Escherichia coli]